MQKHKAFTILEIVFTFFIFTIISSIVFISSSVLQKSNLQKECNDIKKFIEDSTNQATLKKLDYTISFYLSNNMIVSSYQSNSSIVVAKTLKLTNKNVLKTMNAPNYQLHINNKGIISPACTILVYNGKFHVKLTINVGSGHISINKILSN